VRKDEEGQWRTKKKWKIESKYGTGLRREENEEEE